MEVAASYGLASDAAAVGVLMQASRCSVVDVAAYSLRRHDLTLVCLHGLMLSASVWTRAGGEARHHLQFDAPVESLVVEVVAVLVGGVGDEFLEHGVVRLLIELELLAVLEILPVLHRAVLAELSRWTRLLHPTQVLEPRRFSSRVHMLPR